MNNKQKGMCFIKYVIILLLVQSVFLFPATAQINENYIENVEKAYAAKSDPECQSSLKFCNEVLNHIPDHMVINYLAARLNAQLGNTDLALKQLEKATELGYTSKMLFHDLHHLNDTAFNSLRNKEKFKEIIMVLKESEKPVHKSQIAFTISDKKLNPEGITYDPIEKMFYLGSLDKNKIVKVDSLGKSTDFTKEGQDGLNRVLGIHIDPIRRTLWACSVSDDKKEIFKYNLSSGKLIKKYSIHHSLKGMKHWFNDLFIHPNGDVYITGSSSIFIIPSSSDELKLFLTDKSFVAFNGITLSGDGQSIFVSDYFIGIYKIDIETKSFFLLTHEPDFNTVGVDGLYFLNNKLYAVQDVVNTVDRFSLNKASTHLMGCDFFERNTQYLNMPTTGVIVDEYFYFIADTQGKGEESKGIVIMKTSLK